MRQYQDIELRNGTMSPTDFELRQLYNFLKLSKTK